jgi:hypothetical protein
MSNFSDGVPDFEKNVSVDSVEETPSIVEASSGSCSFDIWKNKHSHKDWRKERSFFGMMFSLEEGGKAKATHLDIHKIVQGGSRNFETLSMAHNRLSKYIGMSWRSGIAKARNLQRRSNACHHYQISSFLNAAEHLWIALTWPSQLNYSIPRVSSIA